MTPVEDQRREAGDRRTSPVDRRKYNRRSSPSEVTSPYYDLFERIAVALEDIGRALPPVGPAARPPGPRSPNVD
jgi:hypothetical protein